MSGHQNLKPSTTWRSKLAIGMGVALLSFAPQAEAAGLLSPSDGSLPDLQIRDHMVEVVIEDGYAITTIEQVFANPNDQELEAVYSFPVPDKAAVSGFTYWIDGKPVNGEVLEKKKAKQIYEDEKAAGREAAVTEQDSYKTFDISVWPVKAQQDVRVKLSYIQPTHVDTGIGRYNYPLEDGGVDEEKLAFWTSNEEVIGAFSFDLHLRNSYPVENLRLPKHPSAQVTQNADGTWSVHMDNGVSTSTAEEEGTALTLQNPVTLDTDLVVYWRLKEGLPGAVDLVTHKESADGRGTFMMTLTPGDDLKPITEGRDWIFVLDKSGSMGGKMNTLVEGVSRALQALRPVDRFRIVMFDNGAHSTSRDFLNVTPTNIANAEQAIRSLGADGGTNLYAGLDTGLSKTDADRTSMVILVTDGVANVGVTEQKDFLKLIKKKDVRLFTAIMGNSANRPLLTTLTKESNGTSVAVSNSDDIVGTLLSSTSKVGYEAFHGVRIEIDPAKGSKLKTNDLNPKVIGSLYRGEQLIVFGHYWNHGAAEVSLSGKISGTEKTYSTSFEFPKTSTLNPELDRLWAFSEVSEHLDEMDKFGEEADRKEAVIDLAVEYGLVTPYTSMLVVREDVFQQLGIDRRNRDRLSKEAKAQEQRRNQAVRSTRVDTNQPMFNTPRPSYSGSGGGSGGSGSFGLFGGLLSLLLGGFAWTRRKVAGV